MGAFYACKEPIKIGSIICIGTGDICKMSLFSTLIDRSYVLELDEDYYLDAAKRLTDDNSGVFIQDCFEEKCYNAYAVCLKYEETDKWLRQYEIRALKLISNHEEIFIEYGKDYWCYKPHFMALPEDQKSKCIEHYGIDDEHDLIDFDVDDAEPDSPVNKGGQDVASGSGKAVQASPSNQNRKLRKK